MEKPSMLMVRQNQYHENGHTAESNLQIQCYPHQATHDLLHRTEKKTLNLIWNHKRACIAIQKWVKEMNRNFLKEDIYEGNKHMKKCSSSLVVREMQIKTILRYHLTPVRMVIIKKYGDNRCWRACGEIGTHTVGGNVN